MGGSRACGDKRNPGTGQPVFSQTVNNFRLRRPGATFYSVADIAVSKVESQMKISADAILISQKSFSTTPSFIYRPMGFTALPFATVKRYWFLTKDIGRT